MTPRLAMTSTTVAGTIASLLTTSTSVTDTVATLATTSTAVVVTIPSQLTTAIQDVYSKKHTGDANRGWGGYVIFAKS